MSTVKEKGIELLRPNDLIITKVIIDGLYSYNKRTEISFDSGINLIIGKNGAGKSSIIEAINFAITGELLRENVSIKDAINRFRKQRYFEVVLEMRDGQGNFIRIERRREADGQGLDSLYIKPSGSSNYQKVAFRATGVSEYLNRMIYGSDSTAKTGDDLLKYFVGLSIIDQRKLPMLIQTLVSNRREKIDLINELIGLKSYETAEQRIKDYAVELESKSSGKSQMMMYHKTFKVQENDLRDLCMLRKDLESNKKAIMKELEERSIVLTKAEKELEEINAKILELEKKKEELEEEKSRIESEVKLLMIKREQLGKKRKELEKIRGEISEIESLKKKRENKVAELQLYKDAYSLINIRILTNIAKDIIEKNKLKEELEKVGLKFTNDSEEVNETLERVDAELENLSNKIAVIKQRTEDFQKVLRKKEDLEKTIMQKISKLPANLVVPKEANLYALLVKLREHLEKEIQELSKNIAIDNEKIKELENAMEELKRAVGTCPVCGRELSEEHREKALKELESKISLLKKRLEDENENLKVYESAYNELFKSSQDYIEYLAVVKELEDFKSKREDAELEPLEQRAGNLKLQKQKLEKYASILHKLGSSYEVLRQFDLKELGFSFFSTHEDVIKNPDVFMKEAEKIQAELQEKLGDKIIDDKQTNIKTINQQIQKLNEEISSIDAKIKFLDEKRKQLEELSAEVKALEDEVSAAERYESELNSVKAELTRVGKELENLRNKLVNVQSNVKELQGKIEELKSKLNEIESLLERSSELFKKLSILLDVRNLYNREKIPKLIRKRALEMLSVYMTNYLNRFDLKYNEVKIEPDSFKIYLVDSSTAEEVPLANTSGGEGVAVALSFLVSAQLLLQKLYAGSRIFGFLIMDEPTINLDETNKKRLVEFFSGFLNSTEIPQIIIVTHDEDLKEVGGRVLEVSFSNGSSVVEEKSVEVK